MRKILFITTAIVLLFLAPALSAAENDDWTGPTFEFENMDGENMTQADVFTDGKLYLIDFWASWCRPCQQYLPHLADLVDEFGDRGLVVVIFCIDEAGTISTARAMLAGEDYPFTVLFDPEGSVKEQIGVRRIPTTVLLSPTGEELWRHVGYESGVEDDVKEQIEANLPEEE